SQPPHWLAAAVHHNAVDRQHFGGKLRLRLLDATPLGGSSAWLEGDQLLSGVLLDDPMQPRTETDHEGRFRFVRLRDREYRVLCYRFEPLTAFEVTIHPVEEPVVEVKLPGPEGYRDVAGRVVDQSGVAASDVQVGLMISFGGKRRVASGRPDLPDINARTSDEGGFAFKRVPRQFVDVAIENGHSSHRVSVEDIDPSGSDVFDVAFLCRLVVRGVPDGVTAIAAVDQEGNSLDLVAEEVGSTTQAWSIPVASHGSFPLLWLSSEVKELTLLNGRDVVRRVPVSLVPFQENEVEL
ncbi:MAG: hypothetical protein AAGG01_11965, partial [Planctomycetota bacterium]